MIGVILAISAALTLPWFIFMQDYFSRNMVKTQATVIRSDLIRTTYKPIYVYLDDSGKEHTETAIEGYSNLPSPFNLIYGLKVNAGDKLTLYYDKSNPASTFLMYGWAKGFLILPVYLAIHLIIFIYVVWSVLILSNRYGLRRKHKYEQILKL